MSQALHDGGFPHPRFADQRGVVFGAAGHDLDHPLDFPLPTDDRVQFAFRGPGGEVHAQLIHQGGLTFLAFAAADSHRLFLFLQDGSGRLGSDLLQTEAQTA